MIAVCEITGIEPIQEITFSDNTQHRLVQVWVKSSDEELQGRWRTFVKLWDNDINKNDGMRVGDAVSIRIIPTTREIKRTGGYTQSIIVELIGIAQV